MEEIRQPCGKMWDLEEIHVGKWEKYGKHVVKCETWVNSGRRPLLRKFLKLIHLPGPTSPHLLSANTRIGWSSIQILISTLNANKKCVASWSRLKLEVVESSGQCLARRTTRCRRYWESLMWNIRFASCHPFFISTKRKHYKSEKWIQLQQLSE